MACDFLDYTAVTLTQEEQLTMNSVVQYVRLHNKHRRSIVSTSQLFDRWRSCTIQTMLTVELDPVKM